MSDLLSQLKAVTTVVVDSGDLTAIEQFRPVDATTNPSLLLNASQLEFSKPLLAQAVAYAKSKSSDLATQVSIASDKFAVDIGTQISKLVPGRVSTEVDARLSFNSMATIEKAHQLLDLYQQQGADTSRVLIKVAATWEGIQAAKVLDDLYTKADNDADEASLGIQYQDGGITASVWAPTARSVKLKVYDAGKTLTATLIGQQTGADVYRIDLSAVVSKYIGETEKNLESVFRRAESKNWILFFDEADALFGKRTSVQSSHDKYANQEVSYLLQRVEDYPGLLILASNFKTNLDEAFLRRFHAVIHFPMPNAAERLQLWQKALPASLPPDDSVQLQELAKQYEMSGASILNAVQFAALSAYAAKQSFLSKAHLLDGIRKELIKEEKSL